MSGASGVELIYAMIKAAAWNTAVACGAGNGFLCKPTTVKDDGGGVEIDDSLGLYHSADGTPGALVVAGDIPPYLRYDGLDLAIAMVCGTAGVPVLHTGGAASYDYTYKPAKNTDGLFVTFMKYMKNYIAEVPGLKFSGFTIKGQAGKAVEITFNCIGSMVNRNTTTGTNTLTTFANVTIPEIANQVRFAQGVFRINNQSGIALAVGDVVNPTDFEFTYKRNLKGTYGTYVSGATNPRDVIDEPTNDGRPECTLKLTFPRHTSVTRLTELGTDTRKKMDITFTGAIIEGAIPRLFKIQMPHLQYSKVPITDAQGIIQEPVEFICHAAAAAPAGMTGITDPFWITGTNARSTNPLA